MELSLQDLLWLELALRKLIIEVEDRGDNAEPFEELQSRISAEIEGR
jgi:hypothetical protein